VKRDKNHRGVREEAEEVGPPDPLCLAWAFGAAAARGVQCSPCAGVARTAVNFVPQQQNGTLILPTLFTTLVLGKLDFRVAPSFPESELAWPSAVFTRK